MRLKLLHPQLLCEKVCVTCETSHASCAWQECTGDMQDPRVHAQRCRVICPQTYKKQIGPLLLVFIKTCPVGRIWNAGQFCLLHKKWFSPCLWFVNVQLFCVEMVKIWIIHYSFNYLLIWWLRASDTLPRLVIMDWSLIDLYRTRALTHVFRCRRLQS